MTALEQALLLKLDGYALYLKCRAELRQHVPAWGAEGVLPFEHPLYEAFAESVITDSNDYDALEVQGVREEGEGKDQYCEVDNEDPHFFSVYVHLVEGGVQCIGDFATADAARRYAVEVQRKHNPEWPVYDYTKEAARG